VRRIGALSCLVLLAAGCGTALTPGHLAPDVASTYANLYSLQQQRLGRTDVQRTSLKPVGACRRTGTAAMGPGDDWTCRVQLVDGGVPVTSTLEVQLKPDGCWTADAPPASQPVVLVNPATAGAVTNPLAEFDGCLDTSWG
jgi:hypothetical protein